MEQQTKSSPPPGLAIRTGDDEDLTAVAALLQASDDARVLSADGLLHSRRTRLERGRMIDLVAEIDGVVVATGGAGLNTNTTTEGAAWAFLTVDAGRRREGIGDALGSKLLDHVRAIGGTKVTTFIRWTEEGERWALARCEAVCPAGRRGARRDARHDVERRGERGDARDQPQARIRADRGARHSRPRSLDARVAPRRYFDPEPVRIGEERRVVAGMV